MSYSTERGTGARGVPEAVVRAFQRLADQQRGRPERAMERFLHAYGGGPLWIVMHVGDLIHRMTNAHAWDASAGQYDVCDKVVKSLVALRHSYGFRREADESIATNACYRAARGAERDEERHEHGPACAPVVAAHRARLDDLLRAFAAEHARLPVYNRPQQLARSAAVAMGEQRFEDAEVALAELLALASDEDRWVAEATACQLDARGRPVPIEGRGRGRVVP